jgi:trans-aconitate methyltransferase
MDKYWNKYYSKKTYNKPSDFAKYVVNKGYIKEKDLVIDIACGNGRDTKYLENKCRAIVGIDKSKNAIQQANKICKRADLWVSDTESMYRYNADVFYMRWFLHTVNQEVASKCLKRCYKELNKGGYLLIEARYGKNNIFNWNPFHYRRMINESIYFELSTIGFKIIECSIDSNFSKLGINNPKLIRIICKKV